MFVVVANVVVVGGSDVSGVDACSLSVVVVWLFAVAGAADDTMLVSAADVDTVVAINNQRTTNRLHPKQGYLTT